MGPIGRIGPIVAQMEIDQKKESLPPLIIYTYHKAIRMH